MERPVLIFDKKFLWGLVRNPERLQDRLQHDKKFQQQGFEKALQFQFERFPYQPTMTSDHGLRRLMTRDGLFVLLPIPIHFGDRTRTRCHSVWYRNRTRCFSGHIGILRTIDRVTSRFYGLSLEHHVQDRICLSHKSRTAVCLSHFFGSGR